jgi:glyoxylase-like metal-dependent hydrolase (beta-lactamase superfamily II)
VTQHSLYLNSVIPLATGANLIDLVYLGQPGYIGCGLLDTGEGLALVDPGPATTLATLREAIEGYGATLQDVRILLLTHIHLDHSGGAGTLAAQLPRLRVYVHERGAPHLVDPSKLLRSATMLYGDQMERMWGDLKPVPAAQIHVLTGGEQLRLGSRTIEVAYTPGHAWHHVSYFDRMGGLAFTGDVAGEQYHGSTSAIPVTPPPDVDVDLMVASGRRILEWQPARLCPTHFGVVQDPPRFLAEHEARLRQWSEQVRSDLGTPGTDEELIRRRQELEALLPHPAHVYIKDSSNSYDWIGLARYWRKKLGDRTV